MKKLILAAVILLVISPPARAIDFGQQLTQLDGSPFTEADGVTPEKAPTTVRKVCVNALLASYPDESTLSGEIKLARFKLAKKIADSRGDLELTIDEASLLKGLILKGMPIVVAGQVVPMIENSVRRATQ